MRKFIQTILILSVVSWSAGIAARAQTKEFRVDNVAPMTLVETKASGEKIKRSGVQAIVAAWPHVSTDEMNTFAENLLNSKLREIADRDKNDLIFITFYLEQIPSGGKDGWKTFRVIYTRKSTGWKRLQKEAKVEGADAGRQHVTAAPSSNDRPGYLSTEFLREQAARCKYERSWRSRETSPLEWGDAQHNLGLALWALAEREDSKAHLQSSIAALRNAATVRTRERDAPKWALTQWALGKAMADLATQEQGEEMSIAAIEVYRAVEREKPHLLELTVGKEGLAMPRALLSLAGLYGHRRTVRACLWIGDDFTTISVMTFDARV